MKKIIVCMAVYNEELAIPAAIQAIFNQKTNLPDQLLIVASGCTDNTIPIITKFINGGLPISLIVEEERLGKARALNTIFAYLKKKNCDYAIFTDGDVLLHEDAIEKLISAHTQYPDFHFFVGHPIPLNVTSSLWEAIATENCIIWDLTRAELMKTKTCWPLSGYLFSIRGDSIPEFIPEDCIVEDAFIGINALKNGLFLGYEPNAIVSVQFPKNVRDYYRQKSRTRSGWHKVSLLFPKEYEKLRDLQNAIIKKRILSGSWMSFLCWLIDRFIWLLDSLFTRRKKHRHIWVASPSTKNISSDTYLEENYEKRLS